MRLRDWTLDHTNRLYCASVLASGALTGSGITILVFGAILVDLARLARRAIGLSGLGFVLPVSIAFLAWFLVESVSAVSRYSGFADLFVIVAALPFAAFLPLYAGLLPSRRDAIMTACEAGTFAACFGGAAVAVTDVFLLELNRAEGVAGNPGPFAVVMAVAYGFACVTALRGAGRRSALAAFAAGAAAVALFLSGMRSLWPMIALSPLIAWWVLGRRAPVRLPGKVLAAGAAVALAAGTISLPFAWDRIGALADDIAAISDGSYEGSVGERILIWRGAASLAAERPLTGYGPQHVRLTLAERLEGSKVAGRQTHAHNIVLNAMLRSGIAGLFAQIALLVAPLVVALRSRDAAGAVGRAMTLVLVATYFLNGLFNLSFGHDITDSLFAIGVVLSLFLAAGHGSLPEPDATAPVTEVS